MVGTGEVPIILAEVLQKPRPGGSLVEKPIVIDSVPYESAKLVKGKDGPTKYVGVGQVEAASQSPPVRPGGPLVEKPITLEGIAYEDAKLKVGPDGKTQYVGNKKIGKEPI